MNVLITLSAPLMYGLDPKEKEAVFKMEIFYQKEGAELS